MVTQNCFAHSPAAVMLFHFSICAPVVPSAWKAFPSLMPQLRHGVSQKASLEAGHMPSSVHPIVPMQNSVATHDLYNTEMMRVCLSTHTRSQA